MTDLDMRTNCPYCKVDINSQEHDTVTCLHESYGVYIQAQGRIDAIENRLGNIPEAREYQRTIWERFKYDLVMTLRELVIITALLRFTLFGLGV